MHSATDYPALAALLSGWFHQDFDIEGEAVTDVIAAFKRSSPATEWHVLAAEISRFLRHDDAELNAEFVRIFQPEIDPQGFAPSTRAFLEEIRDQLAQPDIP